MTAIASSLGPADSISDKNTESSDSAGSETIFGQLSHEQVVFCHDAPTGLRAIIAISTTVLGPALGGTRFYPYSSEQAALADVLHLSRAMAYKNALAGLDLGGGKAVIIGDPGRIKSEALLRAYGRFVESLGGRYITACDVGTDSQDMDIIARECRHVTGRTEASGGAGDSSVLTAFGVFQGMRAAAEHVWGGPSLEGKTVTVEGVGKVGGHLVDHLVAEGAQVVIYDVSDVMINRVLSRHQGVTVAATRAELIGAHSDIYSPCALGGALDHRTVSATRVRVICGSANNQLANPGVADQLNERGVVYAPDFVVNAGGVIQVADELSGFNFERARAQAGKIFDTTRLVLAQAARDGVSPATAADGLAERRITEVGRLRTIWLGR